MVTFASNFQKCQRKSLTFTTASTFVACITLPTLNPAELLTSLASRHRVLMTKPFWTASILCTCTSSHIVFNLKAAYDITVLAPLLTMHDCLCQWKMFSVDLVKRLMLLLFLGRSQSVPVWLVLSSLINHIEFTYICSDLNKPLQTITLQKYWAQYHWLIKVPSVCIIAEVSIRQESVAHLAAGHGGNRPSWYIDGLGSDQSPSLSASGVLVIHASQIFSLGIGFE